MADSDTNVKCTNRPRPSCLGLFHVHGVLSHVQFVQYRIRRCWVEDHRPPSILGRRAQSRTTRSSGLGCYG